jgi:hypothetical protein
MDPQDSVTGFNFKTLPSKQLTSRSLLFWIVLSPRAALGILISLANSIFIIYISDFLWIDVKSILGG